MFKQEEQSVESNKLVIDETVKLACNIFRYILDDLPKIKDFDKMDLEQQYNYVFNKEEYKKFSTAYPLVVRYMVQYKTFRVKAFKKYIKHLMRAKPTEEEKTSMIGDPDAKFQWLNKQKAMYVKWLYLEASQNHNMKEANKVYNETLEALNKDSSMLYKSFQKVQEIQNDKSRSVAQLMKEELLKDFNN